MKDKTFKLYRDKITNRFVPVRVGNKNPDRYVLETVPKKGIIFKRMEAKRGGWSEWVYPTEKYLFKCCDCGLVHEMEFKTFLERDKKKGTYTVVSLPKEIRAMFRARRAK